MKGMRRDSYYQQKDSKCKKLMVGDKYGKSDLHKYDKNRICWWEFGRVRISIQYNNPGAYATVMRTKD